MLYTERIRQTIDNINELKLNDMKTAVEWLVEQMEIKNPNWLKEEIEQAKEMEKKQIKSAFRRGDINEMNGIENISSEQYYNETFNK